jgi:GAF domain-containing protein
MLKRLTSSLEEVHGTAGPILTAMQEIASASTLAALIETLRKHVLDEAIDRVGILQIGATTAAAGEPLVEDFAFSDKTALAEAYLAGTLLRRVERQKLVVSNIAALDSTSTVEIRAIMDLMTAASLAIFPLIAANRLAGYLLLSSHKPYHYTEYEVGALEAIAAQVALAVNGFSMTSSARNRGASVMLLNEIGQALSGALDLEMLGEALAEVLTRHQSNITHLSLSLHEAGHTSISCHTLSGSTLPDEIELAGTIFQQVLDSNRTIHASDASALADGAFWKKHGLQSLIVIPLQGAERKIGTLNIGMPGGLPGLIDRATVYSQAAPQVSSALETIILIEQLQSTLDETAALYSSSLAINASQSLEEAYETALAEMAQLSGADRILLYLAGPDPRVSVQYVETSAIWEDSALRTENIALRYGIGEAPVLSQFPQSRANLMFNDVLEDRRLDDGLRDDLSKRGVNALMLIPLSTGTTWLGALLLEGHSGQTFTSDHARLCRNIADQAALVVDSQLLLLRAQQGAEREYALRDTASALSSTLDPDVVLNIVLDNLERVLPHDAANILIVDQGEARPMVTKGYKERGIDEDQLKRLSFQIGAAENLRRMRDQKRPVIITDTAAYPDWVHTPETDWIRSYIGAPIYVEDHLLGFLSLDSATPGFYTEEHTTLLQAFADQAALAIQNAQRFQESRLRAHREELVGQIASDLQRAHTVEDVLQTAARSLQQALGDYDVAFKLTVLEDQQADKLPASLEESTSTD